MKNLHRRLTAAPLIRRLSLRMVLVVIATREHSVAASCMKGSVALRVRASMRERNALAGMLRLERFRLWLRIRLSYPHGPDGRGTLVEDGEDERLSSWLVSSILRFPFSFLLAALRLQKKGQQFVIVESRNVMCSSNS